MCGPPFRRFALRPLYELARPNSPPKRRRVCLIFRGKGKCSVCHAGANFTDERFHNTGVAWREGRLTDEGRFAVTAKDDDHGAFKTPTLREVARTAPYMHDGSLATLEAVVELLRSRRKPESASGCESAPLRLTAEEKRALVAFLKTLSGN